MTTRTEKKEDVSVPLGSVPNGGKFFPYVSVFAQLEAGGGERIH